MILLVADAHPTPPLWTTLMVRERFAEAAETLRRLPELKHRPSTTYWPDIVREVGKGDYAVETERDNEPTAREIDDMEEALRWLGWLSQKQTKLVWAVACKRPWWWIASKLKQSEGYLRKEHQAALKLVAARVNVGFEKSA